MGRRNQWRRWTLGVALVLGAVAIYPILRPALGGDPGAGDQAGGIVGGVCAVLALLLALVSYLWPSPSGGVDEQAEVETALRHLTDRVRELSEQEERKWGINDPEPLPVRWHVASDSAVHGTIDAGAAGEAHQEQLAGTFTEVGHFYQTIPTRRMIIEGEPGSGKTVLAHHLVARWCAEPDDDRRTPVLFRLNTWDPKVELHTWLAEQLSRDFPGLDAVLPTGRTLAAVVLSRGRILPVLDGFDEIPDEFHDEAIEGLSRFHGPLIVTTRRTEYGAVTAKTRTVGNAAAIVLEPLSPEDVRRHLGGRSGEASSTGWTRVFDHLTTSPDEPASRELTAVLSVPLMVMLARTAYRHTDNGSPTELLDISRSGDRHGIEERLLSKYLDTVYHERHTASGDGGNAAPFPCTPDQARRWLGFLADHLIRRDTHDLTWWQLGTTLPRRTRILVALSVLALALGLVAALTHGSGNALTLGLAAVLTAGLALGLDNETMEPRQLRVRKRGRLAHTKKTTIRSAIVLAFAHLFGRMSEVVVMSGDSWDPQASIDPWTLLRTDRTVALVDTVMSQLAFGLAGGLVIGPMVGLVDGPADRLAVGLTFGIPLGLVNLLLSAWGNWLVLARLWLPLTRRLPWRPRRFLEDAHHRGVLRQAGSVYQFRHAQLRDHLTDQHHTGSRTAPPSEKPSGIENVHSTLESN